MNIICLEPEDILLMRDGRPMEGSLAGHSFAWPGPDLINHALHAAMYQSEALPNVHTHRHNRNGLYQNERDRKYGCLKSAGPFPVRIQAGLREWFYRRPGDTQLDGMVRVTHLPLVELPFRQGIHVASGSACSLPKPLTYVIGSSLPPSKEGGGEPWISGAAFNAYLRDEEPPRGETTSPFVKETDISDHEAQIGIAIDPETQTTGKGETEGKFYSAHYLRLRKEWRIGVLAEALDETEGDLISKAIPSTSRLFVGGQQRVCITECHDTANAALPLPRGLHAAGSFTKLSHGKYAVKWILLTPAIWPEMVAGSSKRNRLRSYHPGGWLPNWISPDTGMVLLRTLQAQERKRRRAVNANDSGYSGDENSDPIEAKLVAALIPKPSVVTGWALSNEAQDNRQGGAKSTHLAVPAGAVYYFEAASENGAMALAAALNWHGESSGSNIQHRRSTLMGEKGYGLGVCGSWKAFAALKGKPEEL